MSEQQSSCFEHEHSQVEEIRIQLQQNEAQQAAISTVMKYLDQEALFSAPPLEQELINYIVQGLLSINVLETKDLKEIERKENQPQPEVEE